MVLGKGESFDVCVHFWDDNPVLLRIDIPGGNVFQVVDSLRLAPEVTDEINSRLRIHDSGAKGVADELVIFHASSGGESELVGLLSRDGYKPMTIGRNPGDEGYNRGLGDPGVSRRHFTLAMDDEVLKITNHSGNGTRIAQGNSDIYPDRGLEATESVEQSFEINERTWRLASPLLTDRNGGYVDGSTDEVESPDGRSYDLLWTMSDEEARQSSISYIEGKQKEARSPSDRHEVSQDNIEIAENKLANLWATDDVFRNRVGKYISSLGPDAIDRLRLDQDLRATVLVCFMEKVEQARGSKDSYKLPERIRKNSKNNLKSISKSGYPVDKVTSVEYVALLMLSKIDGSFDYGRQDSTQSHVNYDGSMGIGQHRTAADFILMGF